MKRMLRRVALYFISVSTGLALVLLIAPIPVHVYADHLPWGDSPGARESFSYFYLGRGLFVWAAATLAAAVGFGMNENTMLRRLTLTLPIWPGFLYTQFYLLFMFK